MPTEPHAILRRIVARRDLSRDEARSFFSEIMDGRVEPTMLAAVLSALATKGETVDEIVGAADAMRARATPVRVPEGVDAIDTCGTGGDGKPTFNISSAVAIVAAAAGATVAKHGNRSNARPSGSAEGLAALGINVEADIPTVERCLRECRIAFLYAARLHPAMTHAAPVRRLLGIRTIFNLLGPLTNPARVRRQLVGVNRPELVGTMLAALRQLGAERAMVVHGLDGFCDLSVSGPSLVARWDGHHATLDQIDCRVAGLEPVPEAALFVQNAEHSAAVIRQILAGDPGPARDIVLFNAGAALWVAGHTPDWSDGVHKARDALDSGRANETLRRWCEVSRGSS